MPPSRTPQEIFCNLLEDYRHGLGRMPVMDAYGLTVVFKPVVKPSARLSSEEHRLDGTGSIVSYDIIHLASSKFVGSAHLQIRHPSLMASVHGHIETEEAVYQFAVETPEWTYVKERNNFLEYMRGQRDSSGIWFSDKEHAFIEETV